MLATTTLILLVLCAASIPVAAALGVLGLALDQMFSAMPLHRAMGEVIWPGSNEYLLISIPMFVMLGEVLLRSGIARRVYAAIAQWFSWLPGGLMHANIGTCTLFAATSGSSVATAATIGTVAIPEIERQRYDARLFLGSVAAGGTLGILVPPSIIMVLYGLLTDTSVPQLYLAGFIPGFALAALFMLTIAAACIWRPAWGGLRLQTSWAERLRTLPDLVPPVGIFLVVVGSIYAGVATPTEAAALGVIASLGLAAWERKLTWPMLAEVLQGTMRTTAMIMLIILAAKFLNFVLGLIGLTQAMTTFFEQLGLGKYGMLLAVIAFYVILGCFMESLSMLITTVPLIAPVMFKLGFDPVWFGIIVTILIETALITPPVGMNLYVVQGLRRSGSINEVIAGSIPFVAAMFVLLGLLTAWPELTLWLPNAVMGK